MRCPLALPALTAIVALLGSAAAGSAPPVRVEANASKSELDFGEPFTLEVKAAGPAGTEFTFPAEAATELFELRTPAAPAGKSPAPPGVHRYEAAVFALGEAELPAIPIRYRLPDGTQGEVATKPIALKVSSVLPRDPQQQKLADIRPPVGVSIGRAFWVALVVAVAGIAGLALLWLRRRRRKAQPALAPAPPPLPPDAEARRALASLAASALVERGDYRGFYIRLTTIAKTYLERRLGAPVVEMTTAETLAFLRAHPQASPQHGLVRDLALAADRVKFANGEGLREEALRHLSSTHALVDAIEERLRPVVAGTRTPAERGEAA